MAQPVMVTSFTDYSRQFGGFRTDSFLTYAVRSFYDNGGRRLYIIRVAPEGAERATYPAGSPPGPDDLPISAASEGSWGNNIWIAVDNSSDLDPDNFKLMVMYGEVEDEATRNIVETYDNVTFRSASAADPIPINYVRSLVNSRSEYIAFTDDITSRPATPPITSPPSPPAAPAVVQLTGGSDGSGDADYVGAPAPDNTRTGTGLFALDKITDVNLIAIPGQGDPATVNAVWRTARTRAFQDCFFIGDAARWRA